METTAKNKNTEQPKIVTAQAVERVIIWKQVSYKYITQMPVQGKKEKHIEYGHGSSKFYTPFVT